MSPGASENTGSRPRDKFARPVDALVHKGDNFGGLHRFRQVLLAQFLFEHFAHERDAGQVLTQSVVQILPDPPLLPAADLEDGTLQALRLR